MLKWIARQCGAAIAQKEEKEIEVSIKEHTKSISRRPTSELYGVCDEDFVSAGHMVMCIYSWNSKVHKFRAARKVIRWHRATRILQDSHGACGEQAVAATPWFITRKVLGLESFAKDPEMPLSAGMSNTTAQSLPSEVQPLLQESLGDLPELERTIRQKFQRYDLDGSGTLNR